MVQIHPPGTRRVTYLMALVVGLMAYLTAACGDDPVSDPQRATTCAELIEAGRATAVAALGLFGERSQIDLEGPDSEWSFIEFDRLVRSEAFDDRADALGCSSVELIRRACTAYQGLSTQARGEAARKFLEPYFVACD